MRAIEVCEPGGIDKLVYVERPDPVPDAGEVVVEVAHAAANWSDVQKREGVYPDPVTYPAVLGLEVAGTIAALGPGVSGLALGQRVAAITGPRMLGGYAERCALGADYVIPLPDDVPLEAGAAFPMVCLTAYHLVNSAYPLTRGDRLLVHSIGGAVGLAVTQLAVAKGATVLGTVGRPGKGDRARGYGAQLVVDRSTEDFAAAVRAFTGGAGVDLVIDSLGGEILPRSIELLRTYGKAINIGEAAGYPDFDIRAKLYENSTALAGFELVHALRVPELWRRGIDAVLALIRSGALEMPVEQIFPFEAVHDLHRKLESRGVSGKLLLEVKTASSAGG